MSQPACVLLLSGKRKSGKDFIADRLQCRIGPEVCQILRLSGPLKEQYALDNGLDYQQLLDSTTYKEMYRAKMIAWGEEKRSADPGFFCRKTIELAQPDRNIWIISDARRKTDLAFFSENYQKVLRTIRMTCSDDVRKQRGFIFTQGIDDAESECGLDECVTWDIVISNDGDEALLDMDIDHVVRLVQFMYEQNKST
ncbi:hypothetical protein DPMN_106357 [Dreissena polymorpha]|uniref:Phosphomevalonate kinase n=1 Tax=Dreissena polymorpha TaxID=45954 RepID=A0A9D4QIP3_DREPO|nr:hypothetical protein DPMN_106357 [Dreissena polymorpha]